MDAFAGLSPRLRRLVLSFWWLDTHGKTPLDLGASADEVDPVWEMAMLLITQGFNDAKRLMMQ